MSGGCSQRVAGVVSEWRGRSASGGGGQRVAGEVSEWWV